MNDLRQQPPLTEAAIQSRIHRWLADKGFPVNACNGRCDDFAGLPAGLRVRPSWNPLETGSHVIVVGPTTIFRATREEPYATSHWQLVEQRDYSTQHELAKILNEWSAAPKGCW